MQFIRDFSSLIDSDDIESKINALPHLTDANKLKIEDLENMANLPEDISTINSISMTC